MTNVNIPLLRKAVEWAEAEAQKPVELREWEQRYWEIPRGEGHWAERAYLENRAPECGTTYCIAGYVCSALDLDPQAGEFAWASVAADALGISHGFDGTSDGERLFAADNSIEDVRRIAEDLAGERL